MEVAERTLADGGTLHNRPVAGLILALGEVRGLLRIAGTFGLFLSLRLVLPPVARTLGFDALPDLEELLLHLLGLVRHLRGEVYFLLPVLFDFIELEFFE